jgi:hypothetical protein
MKTNGTYKSLFLTILAFLFSVLLHTRIHQNLWRLRAGAAERAGAVEDGEELNALVGIQQAAVRPCATSCGEQ